MSKVIVTDKNLKDIGNAIRGKNGATTKYKPSEMPAAITALSPAPTGEIEITENGSVDVTNYATANVSVPQPSGTINITSNGSVDVTDYETAVVEVAGTGDQPQLNDVTISLSGDLLTIKANSANGDFVEGYNVYVNPSNTGWILFGTTQTLKNDISQFSIPQGDYKIKVTAIGTNFLESDYSNIVDYTNIFYTITNTLTNCTSNNSTTTLRKGSAYTATITADSGYQMAGATVSVTMGGTDITSTAYSDKTITISSVTDNIIINISAVIIAGAQWQLVTSPDNNIYNYLSVASDAIYANSVGYSSSVCAKSTDGVNWETVSLNAKDNYSGQSRLIFGDNGYIFYPMSAYYCSYSTGSLTSWTNVNTKVGNASQKLCFSAYGNGRIVLGYEQYNSSYKCKTSVSSDNGKTWTVKEIPTGPSYLSGAFLNGLFYVFTGNVNKFYTSADGLTWEEHSCDVNIPTVMPTSFKVDYAVYAQNKYIIKLDGASCIYSKNGLNWTKVGTGTTLSQIAYFNGKFYGENCVSEDGINWTAFESETNVSTLSAFGDKLVGLDKSIPHKFYYATE